MSTSLTPFRLEEQASSSTAVLEGETSDTPAEVHAVTPHLHGGDVGVPSSDDRALLLQRLVTLQTTVEGFIRQRLTRARDDHERSSGWDAVDLAIPGASDTDLLLMQTEVRRLAQIRSAIRRIEDGTHGRCVDCHGAILFARLQALPFATRCRACAEIGEQSSSTVKLGLRGLMAEI